MILPRIQDHNWKIPTLSEPLPLVGPLGWIISRVIELVSLPRTLDRLEAEFPVFQAIGRLGCPMDFMNSTGVLFPMALCGRSSLYSLR